MSAVTIDLLGPPEVHALGQRLGFRTRKALALLAYLAADEGEQPRDRLAAFFWPEGDPPARRAMLRTTLQHLRQAVAPALDPALLLRADQDAVALDHAAIDLDLDAVARAERALGASGERERAALIAALEATTRRFRGEFMQGFTLGDLPAFDHWVATQRERWRERAGRLSDRLIRLTVETGDTATALEAARRWAAIDPLSEAATSWQMRLRFAAGDAVEALRVFEAYQATLARELDAPPGPELGALAARIRAGAPPPARDAAKRPGTRPRSAAAPMVGRANELAHLIGILQHFQARRPQAVLITGEAGIGKTRLARELLRHAVAEGLDCWEARAFEAVDRISYQVVLDALRPRVDRENAPDSLLSDIWLAELSRLLPELRERYPDLPPPLPVGEAEAQARLFEAVARLTQACAARTPVVLFLDDAQWADPASLGLLHYVARQCAAGRVPFLLVATARAEELPAPALAAWVAALGRTLPLTTLPLETLTAAHTQQWVQALAGYRESAPPEGLRPAIGAFSAWLHAETGGHPFFMQEIVRTMRERGLLGAAGEQAAPPLDPEAAALAVRDRDAARNALGIPDGVRDIVRARTQRLSTPAGDLLAAAATIGVAATFAELRAVAVLDEREGLRALEDALDALLLQELPSEASAHYLIAHDKVREAIYAATRGERRRALHRRAFEHLRQGTATPAATLAYHAGAAGLRDEAARWGVRAGDEAMAVFDARRACAYYEDAAGRLGGALERVEPAAYLRLARAQELCGQIARAESTYDRLLEVARAASDTALAIAALSRLATLAIQAFDEPRAHDLIARMLAAAEHTDDQHLQAQVAWTIAQAYNYLARLEPARSYGERAVALATAIGDEELIARGLNALAYIYGGLYEGHRALAAAEESARRYARLGNAAMESDSLAQVASAALRLAQPETAAHASRQARERAAAVENSWGIVNGDLQLAVALAETGALGDARAVAAAALDRARAEEIGFLIPIAQITLATILRSLLDFAGARDLLAEVHRQPLPQSLRDRAAAEYCAACAALGDWATAHALVRDYLDRPVHPLFLCGRPLWLEVEALLRGGGEDVARDYLRRFDAAIVDSPRTRLDYDRAVARLLLVREPIEAIAGLRQAAEDARALDLPCEHLGILLALREACLTGGDPSRAADARDAAGELIDRLAGSLATEDDRQRFRASALADAPA